ncbi:hypothetical protein [Aliiglaciecola litoralis]|uniref:Solute-binding protein family 3/N-terminal domain-containing protein n=1 Tax=Aliiglaciecola litoralis TaxID=582857 RepID=A0ABN1LE73_9ALTE
MFRVAITQTFTVFFRFSVGYLTLFSASLQAENATTILYLQPIPYYMESVDKGTYVNLVRRFSDENSLDFEVLMASSERIEKLLSRGNQPYCSLGFSVELAVAEGLPTEHLIESQSFNRIYTSIISRLESRVDSVHDLDQKNLVVFHGNYQDAKDRIPEEIETSIVTVFNIDSLIKIVKKGRAHAGFVTSPDIFMSPLYQQLQSQLHLVDLPNSNRRESLVCIDSAKNRKLIQLFNKYIDKLRSAGELGDYIDYKPHLSLSN